MNEEHPPLGLLLDVDGPIASPVSRRIAIPSILTDLVTLARAGVPIAFITGRSDTFIREQVVGPLLEAGLASALAGGSSMVGRMFGVCEKGAVWFPITAEGMGEIVIDTSVALPDAYTRDIRDIVLSAYSETMTFDETKHAMISVEQRLDVLHEDYVEAQHAMNLAAFSALVRHGLGAQYGDRSVPDQAGNVPFRVDSTIISTDVESVLLDKDRGAQRSLAYFGETGPLPHVWRSVGDSRSDYLMADHLHGAGYDVAHVDVRPSDGLLEKPYRVIPADGTIHDEAGAAFLRHWVRELGLD